MADPSKGQTGVIFGFAWGKTRRQAFGRVNGFFILTPPEGHIWKRDTLHLKRCLSGVTITEDPYAREKGVTITGMYLPQEGGDF